MAYPEWYPDWRHEAVHELIEKNEANNLAFRIGEWPRYDYDMASGRLTFSDHGSVKVVAEIQVVGTTSEKAGNWMWAWANAHWPEDMIAESQKVRDFGEQHGIDDLVHQYVESEDLMALGWELAAVAARICSAQGAYRPPRDEGGGLFLIYRNMAFAN